MRRVMVVVAGGLALSGCAANNMIWVKASAGPGEFDADAARCQYEAKLGTPNSNYSSPVAAVLEEQLRITELQKLCMQARGWRLTDAAATTPAPVIDRSKDRFDASGVPTPLPVPR